jgi:hypothetical protein
MDSVRMTTTRYLRNALIAVCLPFLTANLGQAAGDKFDACCTRAARASAPTRLAFAVPRDAPVLPGGVGTLRDPSTIKIVLQIDGKLPEKRPLIVNFGFPQRDLRALRDALTSETLEVVVFDQDDRQVLSGGTLFMVDNTLDRTASAVLMSAIFCPAATRCWSD